MTAGRRRNLAMALLVGLTLLAFQLRRRAARPAAAPSPQVASVQPVTSASAIAPEQLVAPTIRAARASLHVVLYHAAPQTKVRATAEALPESQGLKVFTHPPHDEVAGPIVVVEQKPLDGSEPPSAEVLDLPGHRLSADEKLTIQRAKAVTALTFSGPADDPAHLRVAMSVVSALARKTDALIWDDDTGHGFSPDAWSDRAARLQGPAPEVPAHVTIHQYRDGELFRLVTLGMNKFALPDVAIEEVSGHHATTMASLINLLCQTMVERGKLDAPGQITLSLDELAATKLRADLLASLKDGAQKKATVTLVKAEPKEGDSPNTLVAVAFPGPGGLQERHNVLLTTLFGATDGAVIVDHDDEELKAAQARARAKLLAQKPRWADGAPELETLLVKGPFARPGGGNEWMWIEVVGWRGTTVEGILQNDPFDVPDLHAGARVTVEESAVFDYLLRKGGKLVEGGETIPILERKKAKKAQKH